MRADFNRVTSLHRKQEVRVPYIVLHSKINFHDDNRSENLEDNIRLEKRYTIPMNIFIEGYKTYQKKYVYPKNYIFIGIFTVLAANFVYGAAKTPDNLIAYLLIVICLAMAFREWYNPRKMRQRVTEMVKEMGEPVYKLTAGDDFIEFSTENAGYLEDGGDEYGEEELPEPTRFNAGDELKIIEKQDYFLIIYGKSVFYIVPTDGMTDQEKEFLRNFDKNAA